MLSRVLFHLIFFPLSTTLGCHLAFFLLFHPQVRQPDFLCNIICWFYIALRKWHHKIINIYTGMYTDADNCKIRVQFVIIGTHADQTNSINQIMFSILEAEVGLLCHSSFWRRKEDKSLSIKDSCTSLTGRLSLGF